MRIEIIKKNCVDCGTELKVPYGYDVDINRCADCINNTISSKARVFIFTTIGIIIMFFSLLFSILFFLMSRGTFVFMYALTPTLFTFGGIFLLPLRVYNLDKKELATWVDVAEVMEELKKSEIAKK